MRNNLPAPTRLTPFSYFWTCWNVSPNSSPSFSWLMPTSMRLKRTRLPTWASIGSACFLGTGLFDSSASRPNLDISHGQSEDIFAMALRLPFIYRAHEGAGQPHKQHDKPSKQ